MESNIKIGFIGAGNMAEAFISGLTKQMDASRIQISDPDTQRINLIKKKYPVNNVSSNIELFQSSDIVILAVKPQVMKTVLTEIKPTRVNARCLVISIAAGIQIQSITQILYQNLSKTEQQLLPVIRVMPNTPALLQSGMSAYCGNDFATETDMQTVHDILTAMGKVLKVTENQMNAITAISGSGPAYFFYFVESMIQAAKKLGFSDDQSRLLVLQTAEGALQLLKQPNACPKQLRQQVTSKGGTTEAAIRVMAEHNMKTVIGEAIESAQRRAKELSTV